MRTPLLACAVAAALVVAVRPASGENVTLRATLQGGEEVPALLTGAVGTAVVVVDSDTRELTVTLRVYNLPTGSTAGHIHAGSRGIAGPVILNFPMPTGRTGDFTLEFVLNRSALVPRPEIGINTIDDAIQAVVAGGTYANVHTSQYPGGEIRGQLTVGQ